MHDSVRRWAASVLDPDWVRGKSVLEVGSLDVNGSLRPLIEAMGAARYVGTDMREGPGVDVVIPADEVAAMPSADLIVCTEMLEHAENWREAVFAMKQNVRPGGRILLTTRGPGAARHAYPDDYWRFTKADLGMAFVDFRILDLDEDPDSPGVFLYAERLSEGVLYPPNAVHLAPAE